MLGFLFLFIVTPSIQMPSLFISLSHVQTAFVVFLICLQTTGLCQMVGPIDNDTIGRLNGERIYVDFSSGTITPRTLPFDVPFVLTGFVPKNITKIELTIINKKFACPDGNCLDECKECVRGKRKREVRRIHNQISEARALLARLKEDSVKFHLALRDSRAEKANDSLSSGKQQQSIDSLLHTLISDSTKLRYSFQKIRLKIDSLQSSLPKAKANESKLRAKLEMYKNLLRYTPMVGTTTASNADNETKRDSLKLVFIEDSLALARDTLSRKIVTLTESLRAAEDVKDCACHRCPDTEFKTCTVICAWNANFFSRVRRNNTDLNQFFLEIPPMKGNEEYKFFFHFERSTALEKTNLDSFMTPLIEEHLFNTYNSNNLITDVHIRDLQDELRKAVIRYYNQVEMIPVSTAGQPIDQAQFLQFKTLAQQEKVDGMVVDTLFAERNRRLTSCISSARDAKASWDTIISDLRYGYLVDILSSISTPSADDTKFLSSIRKLDQHHLTVDKITSGRISLENTGNALPLFFDVKRSVDIDAYSQNLDATQKLIQEASIFIGALELREPSRRMRLALSEYQFAKYDSLKKIARSDLNDLGNKLLKGFELRQASFTDTLHVLHSKFKSLIQDIEAVKESLQQYKAVLGTISRYTGILRDNSFVSTTVNQSPSMSSTADFFTRTGYYVSADVGIAYAFYEKQFSNELVPYAGVNFHLGPINKQRTYKLLDFSSCRWGHALYKNTSVIVGLTINSLASGRRENTFQANQAFSLLTGVGIRIADPIRLSGGVITHKIKSINPLEDRSRLRAYPYVALSFDLDVGKYLRSIGSSLFNLPN